MATTTKVRIRLVPLRILRPLLSDGSSSTLWREYDEFVELQSFRTARSHY